MDSNEEVITEQSKLITRLTEEQHYLSERNSELAQEVTKLSRTTSENELERVATENRELQLKIEELELMLAKTKVESATKESEILVRMVLWRWHSLNWIASAPIQKDC